MRVLLAIRMLRSENACIESIALQSGWGSKKGLYHSVAAATGLTPSELRALCDEEVARHIRNIAVRAA